MKDDRRLIREFVAAWVAATRVGDVDTVLGLMSEDVVFLVPGQEIQVVRRSRPPTSPQAVQRRS